MRSCDGWVGSSTVEYFLNARLRDSQQPTILLLGLIKRALWNKLEINIPSPTHEAQHKRPLCVAGLPWLCLMTTSIMQTEIFNSVLRIDAVPNSCRRCRRVGISARDYFDDNVHHASRNVQLGVEDCRSAKLVSAMPTCRHSCTWLWLMTTFLMY